jgi:hypothetical protein
LSGVSPFVLSLWDTDTEDSVTDINGQNRSYLLTSWYKHSFSKGPIGVEVTGGIIDASEYVGENAYAGDPLTQFMNEALVSRAHTLTPSYDLGGVVQAEGGALSLTGVVMNVNENDEGNTYAYYAGQVGVHTKTSIGEGHFRVAVAATNKKFSDVNSNTLNSRVGGMLSFDHELGNKVGAWVRLGVQDPEAVINYQNLFSGGLLIRGDFWGRANDEWGIGHGMLDGGNLEIYRSEVTETYLRFGLSDGVSLTLDVQHLCDTYKPAGDRRVEGWVSSLLVSSSF